MLHTLPHFCHENYGIGLKVGGEKVGSIYMNYYI